MQVGKIELGIANAADPLRKGLDLEPTTVGFRNRCRATRSRPAAEGECNVPRHMRFAQRIAEAMTKTVEASLT